MQSLLGNSNIDNARMNRQLFDWKGIDGDCPACHKEHMIQGDGRGEDGDMVRLHVCQSCGHGVKVDLPAKTQYKVCFNGRLTLIETRGPVDGFSDTPDLALESYRMGLELQLIQLEQSLKNTNAQLDSIPKSAHKLKTIKA